MISVAHLRVRRRLKIMQDSDSNMDQLILFRHAKTEPGRPGLEDHDRVLSLQGWDDAPKTMRRLLSTSQTTSPDLILCSTARRCRQTLEAVEDLLSGAPVLYRDDLYLAEDDAILQIAETAAAANNASCVLVIGHNPGLRSLAGGLCPIDTPRAGELRSSFPTSSIAAMQRSDASETQWRLIAFHKVADLKDAE